MYVCMYVYKSYVVYVCLFINILALQINYKKKEVNKRLEIRKERTLVLNRLDPGAPELWWQWSRSCGRSPCPVHTNK